MLEELADNRADALGENGYQEAKGVVRTSFPAEEKFATLFETPTALVRSPSAFVTVQEGVINSAPFVLALYKGC